MSKHSAREIRAKSRVPGIVYGPGFDAQPVSVDNSGFLKIYRKAGTSSLVDLEVDGKKIKVLIHDIYWHPVRTEIAHVDFFAVDLKKKTTVEVPFVFIGESLAVKNLGGMFMKEHESLSIRCLPMEIPPVIEIDISKLENINDHLTIADLNLDEKFEVMHLSPSVMICSIVGHVEEEEVVGEEGEVVEGEGEGQKEEKGEE